MVTRLLPYVINPIQIMGQSVLEYLPKLVFLVLLVLVVRLALRLIRLFFGSVERGVVTLSGFSTEWAQPTYRLVRVAVVAFAMVLAYPYIPGSDSGAFKGVSIFLGVLLSLGWDFRHIQRDRGLHHDIQAGLQGGGPRADQ